MHFVWKMNFVWKIILIQRPAEKAYYILTPIQYPSCASGVNGNSLLPYKFVGIYKAKGNSRSPLLCILCRKKWFWKWYFESTITWGTILHLSNQTIPHVCILSGKWFWINDQLRNHVTFEHQINSQYPPLSIVLIHILIFTLFPVVFSSRIRFIKVVWYRICLHGLAQISQKCQIWSFLSKNSFFSGEIKSFVTHITENPPRHLDHIVFWPGIGQNV